METTQHVSWVFYYKYTAATLLVSGPQIQWSVHDSTSRPSLLAAGGKLDATPPPYLGAHRSLLLHPPTDAALLLCFVSFRFVPFRFCRHPAAFRRPPEEQILIANNGIGAVKAIRSMRRWVSGRHQNERCMQVVKSVLWFRSWSQPTKNAVLVNALHICDTQLLFSLTDFDILRLLPVVSPTGGCGRGCCRLLWSVLLPVVKSLLLNVLHPMILLPLRWNVGRNLCASLCG